MLVPKSVAIFPCAAGGFAHSIYLMFSYMLGGMGVIFCVVMGAMMVAVLDPSYRPTRLECGWLEKWWIRIPICVVVVFSVPSMYLLVDMKGSPWPLFSVFLIGHQWYWEYEVVMPVSYSSWDSSMVSNEGLGCLGVSYAVESYGIRELGSKGDCMLASSDAHLLMPSGVPVRVVITSGDVIHNYNLKSHAISVDAVPGRLNNIVVFMEMTGVFLGWCSENCGVGHYSMPCSMEIISFADWLDYFLGG